MNAASATAIVAGEELQLLPERAVYWTRERTLLVADPHFGKAAAFRAGGVPVPRGTTTENLRRLDDALRRTNARRIVFLGDFLHAREGRAPETLRVLNEWRATRVGVEMYSRMQTVACALAVRSTSASRWPNSRIVR